MADSSSLRTQLLETAKAYTKAHSDKSIESIIALCHPSCMHRGGPPTLKTPSRTNAEYEAFHQTVFQTLKTYHAEIINQVVDEVARKVALYINAVATADGAGDYENTYIITLTMTEDGKLVKDQYDFIDSLKMVQWMGKLGNFADDTWEKK